jgi:preprotein translocase subunit SecD
MREGKHAAARKRGLLVAVVVAGVMVATLLAARRAGATPASGLTITFTTTASNPSRVLDTYAALTRERFRTLGVRGSATRRDDQLIVHLRDVANPTTAAAQLSRSFGAVATVEFRPVLANVPPAQSTPVNPSATQAATTAIATCNVSLLTALVQSGTILPTTSREDDKPEDCVILPVRNSTQRLFLAPVTANSSLGVPAGLSGSDVSGATSTFSPGQGYAVDVTLKNEGLDKFNALAATDYNPSNPGSNSPRDEVAIVLDGLVYSNPAFQTSTFTGPVQITGSFSRSQASDLATVINYGAIAPITVQRIVVTRN